jgi:hypothetical protein
MENAFSKIRNAYRSICESTELDALNRVSTRPDCRDTSNEEMDVSIDIPMNLVY